MQFTKATKSRARLRMALVGPAGSGKTYTALSIAEHLESPIAVIDTERGSASKYSDLWDFDVMELDTFEPQTYVKAIQMAEAAGYKTLIIDSLSHAWMGKGGALEQVDNAAKRSQGNSFGAWRDVTPHHNAMVDAILGSRMHIIVTLRAKTEYTQERNDKTGKTTVRKVGLAPVQRDGLEYEFDVVADLDMDNSLIIGKTRCPHLAGGVFPRAGADVAGVLRDWLTDGVVTPELKAVPPTSPVDESTLTRYSERRDYALRMGLMPPGACNTSSPQWKVDKRLKMLEDLIAEYEAKASPEVQQLDSDLQNAVAADEPVSEAVA